MPLRISYIVAFVALVCNSVCAASAPRLMNLQGRLTDKNGIPLSGAYEVKFSVWNSALGGVMLWDEKQSVACERGVFQILLGSVNPIPSNVFSDGESRYLEIDIESPVNDPPMTPRQRLVTVVYAFLAEEAVHARTADEAARAQTATLALSVPDGTITSQKLAAQSVTSQKISDLSVTETKLADKSVTVSKLSDDALYTDEKAVNAASASGRFLQVSADPATQGQLILPGTSPVISASVPAGKITIVNDTQISGILRVGTNTVTIGALSDDGSEILFLNAAGFITSQKNPLTIQTTQGPPSDITLSATKSVVLSPGWSGVVDVKSNLSFSQPNPRIISAAGSLDLQPAGNIVNIRGVNPVLQTQAGNTLTVDGPAGLNLNTINSQLTTLGGALRINGGNIQDSLGTARISLGDTTVLSSSVTITSTTTIQGNLDVYGKITGDGSGLTNLPTAQLLIADAETLSGRAYEHFLTTSSVTQTKTGGLNVLGNVGIGTTNPAANLQVEQEAAGYCSAVVHSKHPGWGAAVHATNSIGHRTYLLQRGPGFGGRPYGPFGADGNNAGSLLYDGNQLLGVGTVSNTPLYLGTNNTARITITSNGFVGIGTENPVSPLNVVHPAVPASHRAIIMQNLAPSWNAEVIARNSSEDSVYMAAFGPTSGGAPYGPLRTDSNRAGGLMYTGPTGFGIGCTSNAPLYFGTNNTVSMTITNDG
ncbi:MAG: hypothetical protein CVU53_05895, partial [Deltaproteobacteria bacterium HGW-Deltaproteobacteria-11]